MSASGASGRVVRKPCAPARALAVRPAPVRSNPAVHPLPPAPPVTQPVVRQVEQATDTATAQGSTWQWQRKEPDRLEGAAPEQARARHAKRRAHYLEEGQRNKLTTETLRIHEKIHTHGSSEVLTEDEAVQYANGIPKLLRKHRHIGPPAVEKALDKAHQKGRIGVTWLANCLTIDLNNAIPALVARGKDEQALQLIAAMARYKRANQLTYALFFKGCRSVGRAELALSTWEHLSKASTLPYLAAWRYTHTHTHGASLLCRKLVVLQQRFVHVWVPCSCHTSGRAPQRACCSASRRTTSTKRTTRSGACTRRARWACRATTS